MSGVDPMKIEGPKLPLIICYLAGLITGWEIDSVRMVAPEIQAELGASVA